MTEKQRHDFVDPLFTGTTAEDRLLFLRDTFSDAIPESIIHSSDFDHRYKVRTNWWTQLLGTIEVALYDENSLNAEQREKAEAFLGEFKNFNKTVTTSSDIAKANALIDTLVTHVDSDPMLWTNKKTYRIHWV